MTVLWNPGDCGCYKLQTGNCFSTHAVCSYISCHVFFFHLFEALSFKECPWALPESVITLKQSAPHTRQHLAHMHSHTSHGAHTHQHCVCVTHWHCARADQLSAPHTRTQFCTTAENKSSGETLHFSNQSGKRCPDLVRREPGVVSHGGRRSRA